MPMREECKFFESRTYGNGETVRKCDLDLAPEAPWRCPENCPSYERTLIDGTFEQGPLARPVVEDEPEESPEAIGDLLDDAERIVDDAEPDALHDVATQDQAARKWWQPWKRRPRPDDGDDWRMSSR